MIAVKTEELLFQFVGIPIFGIVDNVFRNFQIRLFIADNVFPIIALP